MEILYYHYDGEFDRTYYSALFTHAEYTKNIKAHYFKGYLTEEQVAERVTEFYEDWINWLT